MNISIKLLVISLVLIACSSEDKPTNPQTQSHFVEDLFLFKNANANSSVQATQDKKLADLVLIGTEVVPLSDYKFIEITSENIKGNYYADMGGAELKLTISTSSKRLKIKRVYLEPALKPQVKTYNAVNIDVKSFQLADQLYGRSVKDGILVLETDSGVEGVPNSLWIFYSKKS